MAEQKITVDPRDWYQATKWIAANAPRLQLHADTTQGGIYLYPQKQNYNHINRDISLQFILADAWGPDPYIYEIEFKVHLRYETPSSTLNALWAYYEATEEPPASLAELISSQEGHSAYAQKELTAKAHAGFSEAYQEIYQILFPKAQHWELTSAPEEDYMESVLSEANDVMALVPEKDWTRIWQEMAAEYPANIKLNGSLELRSNDGKSRLYISQPFTKKDDNYTFFLTFYRNKTRRALLYSFEHNNAQVADEDGWPKTIGDMIKGDKRQFSVDINKIKKQALRHLARHTPELETIYAALLAKIRQPLQHWELTSAPEEDYLESITEIKREDGTRFKKEMWRATLLTRLMQIRDPKLAVSESTSRSMPKGGAIAEWQPQGHTNYWFWFNLALDDYPVAHVYCDPALSGSTRGWLSRRDLRSESSLRGLPDSIQEWAKDDLKKASTGQRQVIRQLLKTGIPPDLANAWAKVKVALVPPAPEKELESVTQADKTLISRLEA